jgi:hypothetical protein
MTINFIGGVVHMCPKIVGDTNVTVVSDVTVGCNRLFLYSTINEIDDLLPLDVGSDRLLADGSTVTEKQSCTIPGR